MQPLERAPTPLLHQLLLAFGALVGGAVIVAAAGPIMLLPVTGTGTGASITLAALVVLDLVLVFLLGAVLVRRMLLRPMHVLSENVRRIQEGEYEHAMEPLASLELDQIRESVEAMAGRLIRDQELLAGNIESLDETNRQLVEARDQVIHAARLASVGTLAAGIAHEVGNPLGAIMAYADVAKSRAREGDADVEILDSIREEARRIDRIVRGLLEYARPREAEPGPSSVGDVVDRVRRLLESQGRLDHVESRWLTDAPAPRVVMEPHQLEQVLVNLVLNAVDALEGVEGGRVTVSLSSESGGVARLPRRREGDPPGVNYMHRRRISRDDGGRGIDPLFNAREVALVTVEDNGPGIPDDDLERVFDPFFTTKEPGKGTGLGLSICARLVEGMGGRIEASKREGRGARFVIRLPGAALDAPEESNDGDDAARSDERGPGDEP